MNHLPLIHSLNKTLQAPHRWVFRLLSDTFVVLFLFRFCCPVLQYVNICFRGQENIRNMSQLCRNDDETACEENRLNRNQLHWPIVVARDIWLRLIIHIFPHSAEKTSAGRYRCTQILHCNIQLLYTGRFSVYRGDFMCIYWEFIYWPVSLAEHALSINTCRW